MNAAPARRASRALARWACRALVAACVPAAHAQEATLERSAALRCLSPPPDRRGQPEYPYDAWKASAAGRVKVALVFNGPDLAPDVDVLVREGPQEHLRAFVAAVREHVHTLRVPCVHEIGGQAGRLLARVRFDARDRPPEVQVYARPISGDLKGVVADRARELRMPCHEGGPVESVWTFVYRYEDEAAYGFREFTLPQMLGSVRDIRRQTLQLDTTTMGCPFDLRLAYRQPDLPNLVGEVGRIDPARRPLLDWLATVDLDLPQRTLDAVYGDTAHLQVPCVKIDLKPKE